MSTDLEDKTEADDSYTEEFKCVAKNIKDKKYFNVLISIIKIIKMFYVNNIQGKTVKIKDKNVPLIAIIIAVFFVLYIISPSSESNIPLEEETQQVAEEQPKNTEQTEMIADGVKVSDIKKCEQAVCGVIENTTREKLKRIIVSVTFDDKDNKVLYEGGVEALDVPPLARMEMKIPSEVEFDKYKIIDITVEKE